MKYFCFISGLRGPEGQILHSEVPKNGNGKPQQDYLFGPEPIEDSMSLNEAILKFKDRLQFETSVAKLKL
jgi:hypothetical protein